MQCILYPLFPCNIIFIPAFSLTPQYRHPLLQLFHENLYSPCQVFLGRVMVRSYFQPGKIIFLLAFSPQLCYMATTKNIIFIMLVAMGYVFHPHLVLILWIAVIMMRFCFFQLFKIEILTFFNTSVKFMAEFCGKAINSEDGRKYAQFRFFFMIII